MRTCTCVMSHRRTFRWFSRVRAFIFYRYTHLHPDFEPEA